LFCLEDCFLSLSFSKVKEFSLVSFLANKVTLGI
jgi:hypothetical protein